MTQITFFLLGNADTSLIRLRDGRRMLVDYADRATGTAGDRRCNLPRLKDDLAAAGRDDYAVVAFSHLDDDHCQGATRKHGTTGASTGTSTTCRITAPIRRSVPTRAPTRPNLQSRSPG